MCATLRHLQLWIRWRFTAVEDPVQSTVYRHQWPRRQRCLDAEGCAQWAVVRVCRCLQTAAAAAADDDDVSQVHWCGCCSNSTCCSDDLSARRICTKNNNCLVVTYASASNSRWPRSSIGISPTYLVDDCRLVADARERRLRSTERKREREREVYLPYHS